MTYDAGRIRHSMDLMHYSKGSNGSSIPSNWIPAATGDSGIGWQPQSGGGSVSYGSNSSYVAEIAIVGVATSVARSDHYHGGVGQITSSSSNTLQRGTVNLRAGSNVGLTATDTDGDGEFDTVTISAVAAASGGGGSGGLAQSFLGYNTIGGTWTTVTTQRYYNKKFTLSASSLVVSVDVYLRPSTDNVTGGAAVITNDNSNAPGVLVAGTSTSSTASTGAMYLSNSASMPGAGRWFSFAIGAYLPAGDYWAGFASAGALWDIANDASGSDQIFTMAGGNFLVTGAYPTAWALSDSTRKYSIRVCILS